MNRTILVFAAALPLFLGACATPPTATQQAAIQSAKFEASLPEVQMHFMPRTEVSAAIQECEANNQKAIIQYALARVDGGQHIQLPINVLCQPKNGLFGLW